MFDFHKKHGIKWNPLYEKGMARVGCMPCVNCSKNELHNIADRFPEVIDRIELWERMVSQASKRQSSTFFTSTTDPSASKDISEHHYTTHGIRRMIEWSKTSRGGRQFSLIATDKTECASAYGLCDT